MISAKHFRSLHSFFCDNRPLAGLIYWRRIKVTDGLRKNSGIVERAISAAKRYTTSELPAFRFTESNPEWVMLYDLARQGQITPRVMKNMRRGDLYYLAGHTFPHPALTQPKDENEKRFKAWMLIGSSEQRWDQVTKLQGNAARAKMELERRNFIWTSIFVIIAATLGGLLSGQILS